MVPLTYANYHTPANTAITNSKVGDFLRSKEFYRAKHVDRTVPDSASPSMVLGSIVDCIFSGFALGDYFTRDKENAGGLGLQYVQPAVWSKGIEIGEFLTQQAFFRWYDDKACDVQVPMWREIEKGGRRADIACLPDRLTYSKGVVYIDDLKTTRNSDIETPERWYWKCVRSGYFRQFAAMMLCAAQKFPEATDVVFRHVAVGTTKEGTWPVRLFTIPVALVASAANEFVDTALAIVSETEWRDPPVDWPAAVDLGTVKVAAASLEDDDDDFIEA